MIDANHYLTEKTQLPQFFQFPFFLLDQPISTTAKIVYMILYDRSRLSMQNGWQDDGKIYTIYPIVSIANRIHRSVSSVKTAMNELEQCGLLERKSGGFSKPNLLFIRMPGIEPENKPYDGQISGSTTVSFPAPNKVIELSNNSQNSEPLPFGRYKNIFLTKIDYENLKRDFPGRIDALIESMSSYLETTGKKYRNYDAALRSWACRNTGKPEKMNFYNNEIPYEEGSSL